MPKYIVKYMEDGTEKTKEIEDAWDVKRSGKSAEWTDFLDANGKVLESMASLNVRSIVRVAKEGDNFIGIA